MADQSDETGEPEANLPNKCPHCGDTEEWLLTVGPRGHSEVASFVPHPRTIEKYDPTRIVVCANCGAVYAKTGLRQSPELIIDVTQPSGPASAPAPAPASSTAPIPSPPPPPRPAPPPASADGLDSMPYYDVLKLARELGIDISKKKKTDVIQAIREHRAASATGTENET